MGAIVVVAVFPLLESLVEQAGVVDYLTVQEAVGLLGVDAVGSSHLAVQPWRPRPDPDVADALVDQVPVERRAELLAVECRHLVDDERQLGQHMLKGESMKAMAVIWSLRG